MNRRRVGVIGLGMASPPHIQSLLDLSDRVEVAGAFSPTPERRSGSVTTAGRWGDAWTRGESPTPMGERR